MNLEKIKDIIDSDLPNELKERGIIQILSLDENVIPELLQILNHERQLKKEVITEMNTLLSKAEIGLCDNNMNTDGFMQKEIITFFNERSDIRGIGHCFKNLNHETPHNHQSQDTCSRGSGGGERV